MLFSKVWLLKIKVKLRWANRLVIYVMQRSQIWVVQSLINYNALKPTVIVVKGFTLKSADEKNCEQTILQNIL
jgi:hypothetical protein